MTGPSRAYVMEIESIPDSGVDIRKAVVAPLFAPCFFKVTAAGRTPQEHKGMGIPNRAALKTEINRPVPKCWPTESGVRKIRNKPLIKRPNIMYTDDSTKICHDSYKTVIIKLILLPVPLLFTNMVKTDI